MHDRNGKPLAIGDKVLVEATVTEFTAGADTDFCNVLLRTDVPMAATPYTLSLNAAQTTKVEQA